MKTLKSALLIVLLLSILIVAGCNEGYTNHNYPTNNFAWERSATGNWQPNVAHIYSGNIEYEISRK